MALRVFIGIGETGSAKRDRRIEFAEKGPDFAEGITM
jgi:hypothetical protein